MTGTNSHMQKKRAEFSLVQSFGGPCIPVSQGPPTEENIFTGNQQPGKYQFQVNAIEMIAQFFRDNSMIPISYYTFFRLRITREISMAAIRITHSPQIK